MANEPILNQPMLYALGGQLSNDATTPNTKVDVQAGQFRDSTNVYDINLGNFLNANTNAASANAVTVINAGVNGLNGLDTGSLAASSWYYVYVIADPAGFKTTGCILSLATPAGGGPLMPFGYGIYRRIGQVLTDGSSHILKFWQAGDQALRQYQWDAQQTVITSFATAAFTAQSLSAVLPDIKVVAAYLNCTYNPNSIANSFSIRPTGSSVTAANAPIQGDAVVTGHLTYYTGLRVISAFNTASTPVLSVDLFVTSASDVLNVYAQGYDDYI